MKIAPARKAAPMPHSVQGNFLNLSFVFVFSRMSMSVIPVCSPFYSYSSSSSDLERFLAFPLLWPLILAATAPIRNIIN